MKNSLEQLARAITPARLNRPLTNTLEDVRQAFSTTEPIHYVGVPYGIQELKGEGGHARLAYDDKDLHILMELDDKDIFNPSRGRNAFHYREGDVAEVFISVYDSPNYLEIHVTPSGETTEMVWDDTLRANAKSKKLSARDTLVWDRQISRSSVWVDAENNRWTVLVSISLAELNLANEALEGKQLSFSLSRYNYTNNRNEFVLSSTSPHKESSFHERADWKQLTF